jgi:cell growth-regulating nucleolar protein
MVTFSCDICADVFKKPKSAQHIYRCPNARFTCIDCSTTFDGDDYLKHTSCISEAEKYQKSLYKANKKVLSSLL